MFQQKVSKAGRKIQLTEKMKDYVSKIPEIEQEIQETELLISKYEESLRAVSGSRDSFPAMDTMSRKNVTFPPTLPQKFETRGQHPPSLQQHPLSPQQHPSALQQHPPPLQQHPSALQQHPSSPQQNPASPQQHPSLSQQHPPSRHPPSLQQHPTSLQQHPTSLQQYPSLPQQYPTSLQQHSPLQQNPPSPQRHPPPLQQHPPSPQQHPLPPQQYLQLLQPHHTVLPKGSTPHALIPAPESSELNPHAPEFIGYHPDLPSPVHRSTPGYVPQHEEKDQMSDVLGQLVSLLSRRDHLPPMEPDVFTGDVMKFPMWLKSFECLIERYASTEEDKLFYLGKYTGGEAKTLIDMYLNLEGERVYCKAKMALKRRFGEKYHVAEAFKQQLSNWPNIKPGDGLSLRKLADFLDQCDSARKTTKFLDCLDSAEENQKLLKKLPRYIVDRWNRIVDKWLYGNEREDIAYEGTFPPFTEFCKFLRDEARIACGPGLIGISSATKSQQPKEQMPLQKKTSLAASVSANLHCNVCEKSHSTENCEEFLKMPLEERRATARKKGICYKCLRKGHLLMDCRRNGPSLIFKNLDLPKEKSLPKIVTETSTTRVQNLATDVDTEDVFHTPIIEVLIHTKDDPASCVRTYALLDSQSNACFISEDLARKMNVKAESVKLKISTVLNKNEVISSQVLQGLVIKGVNETTEVLLPATYTRSHIPTDVNMIPKPESVMLWPHLSKIAHQLPSYDKRIEVGLLIGVNCSAALLPHEVAAGEEDEPYALKTVLGWGVIGNVSKNKSMSRNKSHFAYRTLAHEVSPSKVNLMYEQEFSEKKGERKVSVEDQRFLEQMKSSYQREDGHFELPLPLKDEVNLPNNRDLAMKRLLGLHAKMKKNEQFCADYVAFMKNNIDKGYAEKVPVYDVNRSNGQIWYIPHHGVYHPKKPGKIRVVFDCSSEFKGETLNSHLLQGPDLMNSLPGILVRFRQECVAFTCDIEGMFHQVGVIPRYRNLLRFLWYEDQNIAEYRMTVHLFGATSSPACANYALRATADKYESEHGNAAANFIRENFYVDDGLKSVATANEAIDLIVNSHELCRKGGFNLHKFVCTDRYVLNAIPDELKDKNIQPLDLAYDHLPMSRTLGIEWCVEKDLFQFKFKMKDKPVTRRGVLSTVSSIFDPLGMISPVLLPGRKILQHICRDGCSWDDDLPGEIEMRWQEWIEDLKHLQDLQIPRCYKPTEFGKPEQVELHHFTDASLSGYGVCSYLRLINASGQVVCSLILAKSRVTPSKPVTIPRLELTAALLAAKVSVFLDQELDYPDIKHYYWTDSKVVLGYINNEARRFHMFVANRVQQIRDTTDIKQWNYIDSKSNPADLTSRGITAKEIKENAKWWRGPEFLSSQTLPLDKDQDYGISALDDKEVKTTVFQTSVKLTQADANLDERLKYFSNWQRARRAVAVCLRFKQRLIARQIKRPFDQNKVRNMYQPVNVDEIETAETELLKSVQASVFTKEKGILQIPVSDRPKFRDRQRKLKNSRLFRLDPFIGEDGLIRVGGRIKRACLDFTVVHPVIIPKDSYVAKLLISHFHERTGHAGTNSTLSEIRASGYWIIGGRTLVAFHVRKCVTCRKLRGQPQTQKMADLPVERLDPSPPFTNSAVDLFGPFLVKEGRSQKKRWGAMFVCLVSRAIHIEVVTSLTTDSFINAYRRFISRRGPIRQLLCDRGTNFVGAKNELDAERIRHNLLRDNCDFFNFKFNFPHASHMGGAWERMIRSARNALSALLVAQPCTLDDELLHTLLVEAEAIVNSRPLTYYNTSDTNEEPLTPMQLLTLKSKVVLPPPGAFVREDLYCRKRWRKVQYLATEFWRRWLAEYVPTLQERKKWQRPEQNIKEGDIVLLVDENAARCHWPRGIVTQTFPSEDELVRKVKVKTQGGNFERPVHKLILLFRPDGLD